MTRQLWLKIYLNRHSFNQQMVSMVNYQQSYQAAAKLIATLAQTVQSLLAAV